MSEARIFTLQVRVYYEDTDFSGVVYHARYLHFFERARTEALRLAGLTHGDLLRLGEPLAFAVRRMTVDWIAPARIDDLLDVRTAFTEARGARLFATQALSRAGAPIATAEVEAVCMSLSGRPRRPPAAVMRLLG